MQLKAVLDVLVEDRPQKMWTAINKSFYPRGKSDFGLLRKSTAAAKKLKEQKRFDEEKEKLFRTGFYFEEHAKKSYVLRNLELEKYLGFHFVKGEVLVEEEAEEEIQEVEEGRDIGQKFFGGVYCGDVFDSGIQANLVETVNLFSTKVDPYKSTHDVREIFIGADIPYFLTKYHWDKPEFVGVGPEKLLQLLVKTLQRLMCNKSGMVIVFGSAFQTQMLKKELLAIKLQKVGITEVSDFFVRREGFRTRMFVQRDRKSLVNNVETGLQIIFGRPLIDYSNVPLLKARENFIDCKWEQLIKYDDGECVNAAQKPVAIWSAFLKSCKSCDIVFDIFAGTGSLSVAAAMKNLSFVAVEKDEKMCLAINKRLCNIVTSSRNSTIEFYVQGQNQVKIVQHLDGIKNKEAIIHAPEHDDRPEEIPGHLSSSVDVDPTSFTLTKYGIINLDPEQISESESAEEVEIEPGCAENEEIESESAEGVEDFKAKGGREEGTETLTDEGSAERGFTSEFGEREITEEEMFSAGESEIIEEEVPEEEDPEEEVEIAFGDAEGTGVEDGASKTKGPTEEVIKVESTTPKRKHQKEAAKSPKRKKQKKAKYAAFKGSK
jgi:hypothetical protein